MRERVHTAGRKQKAIVRYILSFLHSAPVSRGRGWWKWTMGNYYDGSKLRHSRYGQDQARIGHYGQGKIQQF